jgi:hypothetical protein
MFDLIISMIFRIVTWLAVPLCVLYIIVSIWGDLYSSAAHKCFDKGGNEYKWVIGWCYKTTVIKYE